MLKYYAIDKLSDALVTDTQSGIIKCKALPCLQLALPELGH